MNIKMYFFLEENQVARIKIYIMLLHLNGLYQHGDWVPGDWEANSICSFTSVVL